jgi:hypothetical protein
MARAGAQLAFLEGGERGPPLAAIAEHFHDERMTSVFELLDDIKKRPAMFVGGTDLERGAQLRELEVLLIGYGLAVQRHGLEEPGKDFVRRFARYLMERHGWSASCGPIAAIRANAGSDDEAWDLFWRLVDEFKRSAHPK